MGYPKDLLSTRAIIKPGKCALIPPEGRVNNVIPNLANCRASILCSPDLGAKFAFYTVEVMPGGGTTHEFYGEGIETFIYCLSGEGIVNIGGKDYSIGKDGFAFAPASTPVGLHNNTSEPWSLLLYKQRYRKLEGFEAKVIVGNLNDIQEEIYDGMENVRIKNLLPNELGFDFNFHTLTFYPGACHSFVETHVQEHGIYFLQGEGVYLIDDVWVPVKKDDFIYFGPYVPQAYYAAGRSNTTYIYSKDCNRDVDL
ncbi:(S)-ureidoglycine aminohydrolase [Moorella sulfitireducens (nom. illeg.)]|uniref:(S)-ureidoglycine aminohydrolase n=1 Tax=Neomoorella sulfitireducens TaxID=2972948 RepID=UPI0021AC6CB5|nr:(S)-ureidoglycine aminohydrolase [Moorella sulfitireducens]